VGEAPGGQSAEDFQGSIPRLLVIQSKRSQKIMNIDFDQRIELGGLVNQGLIHHDSSYAIKIEIG
jgi:cytochrome c-type biogenesis protein CcmE